MHRKKLLSLLNDYIPVYHEEIVYKDLITIFINHHPGCFERSERIGHITASSLLLNADGSKALLTHHKKLNRWLQLGGHCDGNPDVLDVSLKEAREESGINHIKVLSPDIFDIDIHLIPFNSKEAAHYHYDIRFLLQIEGDENDINVSDESHNLKWISSTEELSTDYSVNRLLKKWKNQIFT